MTMLHTYTSNTTSAVVFTRQLITGIQTQPDSHVAKWPWGSMFTMDPSPAAPLWHKSNSSGNTVEEHFEALDVMSMKIIALMCICILLHDAYSIIATPLIHSISSPTL